MNIADGFLKRNLFAENESRRRGTPVKLRAVVELGAHSLKFHRFRSQEIHTVKHAYTLGHEVYTTGRIFQATAYRILELIRNHGVHGAVVIGTSAIRDAENRHSFVRLLKNELGITVHVLSPWEEASLLAAGYLAYSSKLPALVADLGGGSLELVFLNKARVVLWDSLPVGAIRMFEKGLQDGCDSHRAWTQRQFKKALVININKVYATGGTAAAIAKTLNRPDFSMQDIDELEDRVQKEGPPPGLKPERAKVFLCGLLLVRELFLFTCADKLHYMKISIGRVYLSFATLFDEAMRTNLVAKSMERLEA